MGTQEDSNLNIAERTDRCVIGMGYITGNRTFAIRIIVYENVLENDLNIYQKDTLLLEEYVVNGITHYITENNSNLSAMWANENVEGYIQGDLTLEEMRQMIDSIYKE